MVQIRIIEFEHFLVNFENYPLLFSSFPLSFYFLLHIHIYPWVELSYMYSGSCIQKINGKPVELKQGQTLLLDLQTIHEIPVLADDQILLNIFIRKEYLNVSFFNRFSHKIVLKYIEEHYQTLTLQELSALFCLNPDYLSRLLKNRTGQSFQALVTSQRMSVAKQHQNVTFFYKKFAALCGCSPGEYRKAGQS